MIKIKDAFNNGKSFIPYITAGYPDIETTEKLILAMAEEGVDLIEIGIPFSDPTAEGPVIQNAIETALSQGLKTDDVFDMVGRLREKIDIPLVFMTYANIVYGYGAERFMEKSEQVGIQGLILPDVPFEEKEEFSRLARQHDIEMISLVSPTSKERITKIAQEAEGFIYVVSSLGVTGTRSEITTDLSEMIEVIRSADPELPAAIGFGISGPEQAQEMSRYADGVIVGSAIIQLIDEYGEEAEEPIRQFTRHIKEAVHR